MPKIKWKPLLISLAISLGTGALAAFLTSDSQNTYGNFIKPPFSPPPAAFPIVWTILFILMGISAYLVYISESPDKEMTLKVYLAQLFANFFWTILFFSFHLYWVAFFWLLILAVLVYLTTQFFYQINELAGQLMIPYLLWIVFAGYLNLAIAILN